MDGTEMTAEGLESLKAEIRRLETQERANIAEQIKTARAWGDLSENAEYHAAKEAQAHLETRIAVLRERMVNAVVVEAATGEEVGFGSTVEVRDRKSTRLNSSHANISYAVFCLKKKKTHCSSRQPHRVLR